MPESLTSPDGAAVPMDPEFARAMAAPEPGAKPDYPAPPKRDPKAPHGYDGDGKPKAPYGYKADGVPRQVPAGPGKPSRQDKARVQAPAPKTPAGSEAGVKVRRAEDATTTFELLSAGASLLAMLGSSRAVANHAQAEAAGNQPKMKAAVALADRCQTLQLDAAAIAIHAEAMGPSLAEMAEKNRLVAALVDRLALFNGVASVGIAVMPLVYQLAANHAPVEARDNLPPQLLQLGVLPPTLLMEKLEAQNAVKMARAQSAILAEKQAAEEELAGLRENQAGYVATG
jgi:hypothetical protein